MFPRNILFLISACLVWFVLRRSQVKIQIFIFSAELCNETFYVVVKIVVLGDCWFFSLYLWGTGGEGRGGGLKPALCFFQIRLNLGRRILS